MIQYDSCGVSEFLTSSNFDKFARPPLLGQMASDKFHLLPSTHGQRSISNYSIQKTCIKFIFHVTSCQRKNNKPEKNKHILYKIGSSHPPFQNPYFEQNHPKPWFGYKIRGPTNRKAMHKMLYLDPCYFIKGFGAD